MSNDNKSWYLEPLKPDDVFAGAFLLSFGLTFMPIYAAVAYVMFKNDKDIIGFRFLFSASIADMVGWFVGIRELFHSTTHPFQLILFNYAVWPGLTILFKNEFIRPEMRHWVQMYLDWVWFSMCWHYMVIAWSRFAAIRFANSFRVQPRAVSYSICAACYTCALIQVLCTHFQHWYVTFYYEPSAYGMLAEDFGKYLTAGHSLFFFTFHLLMMIIPIFFYGCALGMLLRHRKAGIFSGTRYGSKNNSLNSSTEARLLLPCIFNSAVFIVGQVVITIGTGEGKWATWMVLLLFSFNSAVNPILLLTFSGIIRQKTVMLVMMRRYPNTTNYSNVPPGRNSTSPSPLDKRTVNNTNNNCSLAMKTEHNLELLRQVSEPILAQEF